MKTVLWLEEIPVEATGRRKPAERRDGMSDEHLAVQVRQYVSRGVQPKYPILQPTDRQEILSLPEPVRCNHATLNLHSGLLIIHLRPHAVHIPLHSEVRGEAEEEALRLRVVVLRPEEEGN